jgi:hypothetical protein
MKIRPVRAELFHMDGWTNRQTDEMQLIVAIRKFLERASKAQFKT